MPRIVGAIYDGLTNSYLGYMKCIFDFNFDTKNYLPLLRS